MRHERAADPGAASLGRDGDVMQPAPDPVASDHRRPGEPRRVARHEYGAARRGERVAELDGRIVGIARECAVPKGDHVVAVRGLEGGNTQGHRAGPVATGV